MILEITGRGIPCITLACALCSYNRFPPPPHHTRDLLFTERMHFLEIPVLSLTIIIINIYFAQIPCEYDQMLLQTNTIQIKHNRVRIPTGGRLTSWLFTRRGGVEFWATEDKSIQWQGGGFEPGTSGIQVQRPTTRPRTPPESKM